MALRSAWPLLLVLPLSGVAQTTNGQGASPCDRCKPVTAQWDWKANGYALAETEEGALELSKKKATDAACEKSKTFLDANKLKCKGGCDAGEVTDECAPSEKPKCDSGSYEKNKGMWTFVCRKHHEGTKVSCDKEEAAKHPGYTMCDVSVRAVRTLACSHPDCTESDASPWREGHSPVR